MSIETFTQPDIGQDPVDELAKLLYKEALGVKGVEDIYAELEEYHEKTARHCKTVALIASELTIGPKIDRQQQKIIVVSALLHDIGKRFIGTELIDFPDEYNDEQRQEMKNHVPLGVDKLIKSSLGFNKTEKAIICSIVAFHHSPKNEVETNLLNYGLDEQSKDLIRLGLVIVRLADVGESMTGDTHDYKARNLTADQIMEEIIAFAKMFPDVKEKSALLDALYPIITNLREKNNRTNISISLT
jgi:putative nucleotidyltransferase with HDIG domain